MKNNITELVCILDRSGSMSGLESDTIGGFNSLINKQKKEDGMCYVSTVLFNSESTVIHDRVPIEKIEPMTADDYVPGGKLPRRRRGYGAYVWRDGEGGQFDAVQRSA